MNQTNPNAPVLIVIPCLNEANFLTELVEQLTRTTGALNPLIIIADGGSTDGTVEIAQSLSEKHDQVHYLHNPKRIQSAAINAAVTRHGMGCDYLIRIDAHADYPDNYCTTLLEEAMLTGADSVVVSMDTKGNTPFQKAVAVAQNSKLGNGGSAHRNQHAQGMWVDHGHHALMRISAFATVGGYDEDFTHNEDAELDLRLQKAGFRVWLTAKTYLTYYPRADAFSLWKQYRNYGAGRMRNMRKHHTRPNIRQLLPACVFPAVLLALATPFFVYAALPFLAWAYLCVFYGALLAIKAKDPVLLLSGPAGMIMHASWSLGFWQAAFKRR